MVAAEMGTKLKRGKNPEKPEKSGSIILTGGGDLRIVNLGGCVLQRDGTNDSEFILPAQSLAPGAFAVFDETLLGFRPQAGDKLFLYAPSLSQVLDAVVVKDRLRGRFPDGTGRWLFPSAATPGASNDFEFHRG